MAESHRRFPGSADSPDWVYPPGSIGAFKEQHGIHPDDAPVPSYATPDCGCRFDPKAGRQVAVGPGCVDVRGTQLPG